MLLQLENKVAVITGGAKGIGAATAALFEKSGAKVEVLDIERGIDVTREDVVRDVFAKTEKKFGAIDVRVNSAGGGGGKRTVGVRKREWAGVLDLTPTARSLSSRWAHPQMKKRGAGATVNPPSIMAFSGGIYPNAS